MLLNIIIGLTGSDKLVETFILAAGRCLNDFVLESAVCEMFCLSLCY